MSISLNLRSGYTNDNSEVIEAMAALKASNTSIDVQYISREDAFEILRQRDEELARVIDGEKDNPLPSSIVIKNIPLKEYPSIHLVIERYKGIVQYDEERSKKSLVDYQAQYERIQALINIILSVRYGIYSVIGFFLFAVFVIIYNNIGNFVFFYRDEIKIIRLVGGDNIFVYGPFSIQGALYTGVAYILGTGAFSYIIEHINFSLITNFPLFIDRFFVRYGGLLSLEFLVIVGVGVLSGLLSSRRFIGRESLTVS